MRAAPRADEPQGEGWPGPINMARAAGTICHSHRRGSMTHLKTQNAELHTTTPPSVAAAYGARGAAQQQTPTPNRATSPSLARLCRLCGGRAPAVAELGAAMRDVLRHEMRACRGARSCLCATRWPPGSGPSGPSHRCELPMRTGNGAAKCGGPADKQRGASASRQMTRAMGAECEDRRTFVGRLGARRWQVICGGVGWIPGSGAADMTAGHYSTSK